jgi:predicted permease
MGTLRRDLRYAGRLLVRNPGFTAVVVLSIALGIGANTLIFSVVHAVLIRSLPYRDPDRLVMVWFTPPKRSDQTNAATVGNYLALRERNRVFEYIGGFQYGLSENLRVGSDDSGVAEQVSGQRLTAALPPTLGVSPLLGRWFTDAEAQPGAAATIVIGYRLWQRRFAGAPDVIGKTVRLDGAVTTIIGVMRDGFEFFNQEAEYWAPIRFLPSVLRSPTRFVMVAARLKPGVSFEQAQHEMNSVAAGFAEAFPNTNKDWGIKLEPLQDAYVGWLKKPLLILQGVVAFVLLIACANVAGLLLAQAAARDKEVSVRAALGSSRWRIVRQFLTESVLLSLLGGALGVALAFVGLRAFVALSPVWFPRLKEIALDTRVLGFTALLSFATGLIFGVFPALQSSRPDLVESLKESTRGAGTSVSRQRLRSALVVSEISLALVLLIGSGLMINTFLRLYGVQPGCNPRSLATFQVHLARGEFVKETGPLAGYQGIEISPRVSPMFEQIRERLAALPGVQSAAAATNPPLSGWSGRFNFSIEGRKQADSDKELLAANYFPVSADYFHTLNVPLLRGREFRLQDSATAPPVVIVNDTMAHRFWPNEDPLGKRLRIDIANEPPREIVGVVGDVRQNRYDKEAQSQMYLPHVQQPLATYGRFAEPRLTMTFVVRSGGDPMRLVPGFRAAVSGVDRSLPISNVKTVEQYVSEQLQEPREYMALLSIFSAIAVALAIVGVYGIMAYSVRQRTHEIGIRMALGAGSGDVMRLVIRRGLILIALGTGFGLVAALVMTGLLKSFLWGVTATDPVTFTLVVLALVVVALLACYLPARRALKIDPMIALRYE